MMGNRGGCLHDAQGRLTRRAWASRRWIACALAFKGRRRAILEPGKYTELFFLDEATALAAGHRPCFECRRADAQSFAAAMAAGLGRNEPLCAEAMDALVHEPRAAALRGGPRPMARLADLPAGAMVAIGSEAWLIVPGGVRLWSFTGYGPHEPLAPRAAAALLTPRAYVEALRQGYAPRPHPSAA